MATKKVDEEFFQPVISTLGLSTSIIATLIPLFPVDQVKNLFIEKQLIGAVSASTFLLGFIIIWLVIELRLGYLNIPIGRKRERGNGYPEPWHNLTPPQSIGVLILIDVILLATFLSMSKLTDFKYGVTQAVLYVVFFLVLIAMFAFIYSISKMTHDFDSQKMNLHTVIFNTLERSGHISSALEIQEVYQVNNQQLQKLGIVGFQPLAKFIILKTNRQEEKRLECILSGDCKEIIRVRSLA